MSSQGWLFLIIGGTLGYILIKAAGATYSANPLTKALQQRTSTQGGNF